MLQVRCIDAEKTLYLEVGDSARIVERDGNIVVLYLADPDKLDVRVCRQDELAAEDARQKEEWNRLKESLEPYRTGGRHDRD